ncbi:Holliday junction DNA helicase subunit RuvA [Geodermatophilus sabuli]|uniref:Holliday junction branch migration complex subunit RuvA n=1 Tax=Geodermatophilus sabuli TaxID=1564158 RepID=A0A285E827_9ACTN|nr:Holliday junction DNA helicase subunit RuvA [Geodermatophilus sabuli]
MARQAAGDDERNAVIASVSGRVAAVSPDGAVVEVGGIGLAVQCTPGTIARLQVGEGARLSTSLVVREDSLTLYGFADDDERQLFELLQTANGVGPRLAQAVLAIHPPREVRRAVSMADVKALMQVPGIGKKGAERLILELRDRLGTTTTDTQLDGAATGGLPSVTPVAPWRDQLSSALVGLGWTSKEADGAVAELAPFADEQIVATGSVEVAVLLRQALRMLGRP